MAVKKAKDATELMRNVYTMPCKPGSIYINFGNTCLNDCLFCVKRFENFFGYKLNVSYGSETLSNIEQGLERIKSLGKIPGEIVICGTGEPFIQYDSLIEICKAIRKIFGENVPIRADTAGLWWDARKDLSFLDFVDSISVSLNAESAEKYELLCQPKIKNAYSTLMGFLGALKKEKEKRMSLRRKFPDVRLTLVNTSEKEFMPKRKDTDHKKECPVPDINACKSIAKELGFPLVVKHLFRDVNDDCWQPQSIELETLKNEYLEKCVACKHRHV